MDLRIEKLQEKYWAGETTLAEEKELKAYFRENPSLAATGSYHRFLNERKDQHPEYPFTHPGRKTRNYWLSIAAAILVMLTVGVFMLQNKDTSQKFAVEDPEQAMEVTRASLMIVSEGLNKGKTYSKDLKKINKAKELIKQ
jgi:hypothetical protein